MGERNALRDRTLILRIQDEALCQRLRNKMSAVTERATILAASKMQQQQQQQQKTLSQYHHHSQQQSPPPTESKIFDLEDVTCVPSTQSSSSNSRSFTNRPSSSPSSKANSNFDKDPTLWHFRCDGVNYPSRLTNLPCPVELHKTRDRKLYHKSVDVAQILIVYPDLKTMEAMERYFPRCEGFPSYHPSGLTPPMGKVVEERFSRREHDSVPPPRQEIIEVERELVELVKKVVDGGKKVGSGGGPKSGGGSSGSKILQEVEDEIVPYEPWMDTYGTGKGVEFTEDQELCLQHPELWLDPNERCWEEKTDEQEKGVGKKTNLLDGVGDNSKKKKKNVKKKNKRKKRSKSSFESSAT